MQKVTLNVEGMSCQHCENRVKKAVGELAGVSSVDVDLKRKPSRWNLIRMATEEF